MRLQPRPFQAGGEIVEHEHMLASINKDLNHMAAYVTDTPGIVPVSLLRLPTWRCLSI
jgi:hypothetical protein